MSKHGLSLRRIAAEVGNAVNTVRRRLALTSVPKYERKVKRPNAFMRSLRPTLPVEPEVRFETAIGEQLQADWVEFRKSDAPLHAFCATMDYGRASDVELASSLSDLGSRSEKIAGRGQILTMSQCQ